MKIEVTKVIELPTPKWLGFWNKWHGFVRPNILFIPFKRIVSAQICHPLRFHYPQKEPIDTASSSSINIHRMEKVKRNNKTSATQLCVVSRCAVPFAMWLSSVSFFQFNRKLISAELKSVVKMWFAVDDSFATLLCLLYSLYVRWCISFVLEVQSFNQNEIELLIWCVIQ